jgi:hypothetical protein
VDVHGAPAQERLAVVLRDLLLASGTDGRLFEIRLVPDAEFGFVHGKGGVIAGPWGRTAFIGSANDSARAWTRNYELVWEDADPASGDWVQQEFDALWARALPLSEFIVKQIGRLAERTVIEHVGPWRERPRPEPMLAEVPTVTERDEFHSALPDRAANCPRRIGIVSTSVITNAPRSPRNQTLVEQHQERRCACAIWDEAHRIRRANLSPSNVYAAPEKKLLYRQQSLAGIGAIFGS